MVKIYHTAICLPWGGRALGNVYWPTLGVSDHMPQQQKPAWSLVSQRTEAQNGLQVVESGGTAKQHDDHGRLVYFGPKKLAPYITATQIAA